MIRFLLKGLLRDRSRSLLPVLVVMAGTALTVLAYCWITGALANMTESSARFATGHLRVMSRAYAAEADLVPNELALTGVADILSDLRERYPEVRWTPRIKFGGLLDIPDENGETRAQGPAAGLGLDLLSPGSPEPGIMGFDKALVRGRLPEQPGEILISDEFATQLDVEPGATATLISSSMYGSLTTANFIITGTVRFGVGGMDRGAMIADIRDIQYALDMEDAAGEVFGFMPDFLYRDAEAGEIAAAYNAAHMVPGDESKTAGSPAEFAPMMSTLKDGSGLAQFFDMIGSFSTVFVGIFVGAMALVLWNAGLMGNLRRYGEFGMRLAIGEYSGNVYRSLIVEAVMVGIIGSVLGTALGLGASWLLQTYGIDVSGMMRNNVSVLLTGKMRALITPTSYYIGFLPGVVATVIGTAISGISVLRRKTSQLTRELEA